jgi:hypothetical protein
MVKRNQDFTVLLKYTNIAYVHTYGYNGIRSSEIWFLLMVVLNRVFNLINKFID